MARLLILLALGAITYTVISAGPPTGTPTADAAVATPHASLLAGLDLTSLIVGLVAGFAIGWVWSLPWRNFSELMRELAVRSLRGFGLVGLAMVAAAFLMFY